MGFAPLEDTSVAIEEGVNIPPCQRGNRFRARKYPWVELEIGQSFLVAKSQLKFGGAVDNARKRYGIQYTTRSVMINGVPHTRVWRTG